jgi:hypothetical protein
VAQVLLADIPSALPAVPPRALASSQAVPGPSIQLVQPLVASPAPALREQDPALALVPALVRRDLVASVALVPVRADLHPLAKRRVRSALPLEGAVDVPSTPRPKKVP